MPTWNTSKPATVNSVAADIADIEENFDFLEDLLTNWFKTWSSSSTAIGKTAIYYVNPASADQGADDDARSAKDLIDYVGATRQAIIYFPHHAADGNTTTFTFGTAETAYDNHTLIFENGSIIAGAGAFTIQGTAIALGDLTISGTVVVDAGARLITFGTLTVSGTLTIAAGGKHVDIGGLSVSGTYSPTGYRMGHITLDVDSSSQATSGTDKTNIYTITVPANILRVGKTLRAIISGSMSASGTSDTSFFFSFGAVEKTYVYSNYSNDTHYWQILISLTPYNASNAYVDYTWVINGTGYFIQAAIAYDTTSDVVFNVATQCNENIYGAIKKVAVVEIF